MGIATDVNGNFSLVIPDSILNGHMNLVVTYIGYEPSEMTINRQPLSVTKEILLIPVQQSIIGEITVVKKRKWWQKRKH